MKRKIKTGMIALGCCILVMTGVYGAFTDRLSVTSHIVTGDVHIGIQEFTRINKIEKNYTDPGTILPGMKISKIPRIINKIDITIYPFFASFNCFNASIFLSSFHIILQPFLLCLLL